MEIYRRFILFVIVLLIPLNVSAASGCCSHHGGVDCSRIQSNGKVICNDGWTGSSCSYSGMAKCRGQNPLNNSSVQTEKKESEKNDDNSATGGLLLAAVIGGLAYGSYATKNKKKNKN